METTGSVTSTHTCTVLNLFSVKVYLLFSTVARLLLLFFSKAPFPPTPLLFPIHIIQLNLSLPKAIFYSSQVSRQRIQWFIVTKTAHTAPGPLKLAPCIPRCFVCLSIYITSGGRSPSMPGFYIESGQKFGLNHVELEYRTFVHLSRSWSGLVHI